MEIGAQGRGACRGSGEAPVFPISIVRGGLAELKYTQECGRIGRLAGTCILDDYVIKSVQRIIGPQSPV